MPTRPPATGHSSQSFTPPPGAGIGASPSSPWNPLVESMALDSGGFLLHGQPRTSPSTSRLHRRLISPPARQRGCCGRLPPSASPPDSYPTPRIDGMAGATGPASRDPGRGSAFSEPKERQGCKAVATSESRNSKVSGSMGEGSKPMWR